MSSHNICQEVNISSVFNPPIIILNVMCVLFNKVKYFFSMLIKYLSFLMLLLFLKTRLHSLYNLIEIFIMFLVIC
jgi:hypothetical protein